MASALYAHNSKPDKLVTQFDSVGLYKDAIRQINRSYANAANQCKLTTDCKKHKTANRMQPSPYKLLSPDWLTRFWEIATTTNQSSSGAGFCGICALHTMEMISEVIAARFTHSLNPPVTPSFMRLAANTNPFTHLRLRYPRLMDRLEEVSKDMARHVVMAYRSDNGIHIMPTNMNITFDQYAFIVRHGLTTGEDFLSYLLRVLDAEEPATASFHGLIISTIGERIANDEYSGSVSFSDCLGARTGRRGNGRSTNASIPNSCVATGRCVVQ